MAFGLVLTALAGVVQAPSPGVAAQASDESPFDKVWSHATLYDNKDSSFIQEFSLRGRLQVDSALVDGDQGEFSDVLWRRFRLGFKATLFQGLVLHVEGDWNLNEDVGESYSRLTDAYIGWYPSKNWGVKILKQSAGFTLDGATSSKNLLTLQRNNLTNNLWFTAEYFTGASISGTVSNRWDCTAGVFSSDGSDEMSHFEAATFMLLSLGSNFAEDFELDNATIRVDYVYNKEDEEANTRDLSQVLSLVTKWEAGAWGLWTDLSVGKGYGSQSDLWGVALMPFYDISQNIQLVLRYTYLKSADRNGVRLVRYETEIVEGRGDEYNEVYGGLNVYFFGHKLKWQTGLKHATMGDEADDAGAYEGWSISTGLRVSW
jgi:phosphate-selective porin OprO/OprP